MNHSALCLILVTASPGLVLITGVSAESRQASPRYNKLSGALPSIAAINVIGASSEELHLIRKDAEHAIELFAECGLKALAPIRIRLEKKAIDGCGVDAFGAFDTARWTIRLVAPNAGRGTAKSNPAYASLPLLNSYESLVLHQVAHQTFRSHLGGRTVALVTHEYVAHALQIASMPLDVRKAFLKLLNSKVPTIGSRLSR